MTKKGDERWVACLEGYRSLRLIGETDLEAVPLFVAARAVWLRGLHAANTAHWGRRRLNDGYWDRLTKGLHEWQAKHLGRSDTKPDAAIMASTGATALETVVADAPALSRPKL